MGAALEHATASTALSGVVRVDQNDETVIEAAYGLADRSHGILNDVNGQFGIASGTKGLTALAVVRMVEEGLLEFGASARSLLADDLPLVGADVTVEHLLSHRSGIGDYFPEATGGDITDYVMPIPVHQLATTEQYLRVIDGHPPTGAPGERFAYSNSVYRQMVGDQKRLHLQGEATGPGGHVGAPTGSSAADSNPDVDASEKSLPGPAAPKATPAPATSTDRSSTRSRRPVTAPTRRRRQAHSA